MTAHSFWKTLALLPLLLALGCSGAAGTVKVNGKVTLDGKPLPDATVMFVPEDGNGTPANGMTGSDGSFRLTTYSTGDGARPGTYKVVIQLGDAAEESTPISDDPQARMEAMKKFKAAPKKKGPQLPASYSDPKKTTLKQVVPPTGEVLLELRSTGG